MDSKALSEKIVNFLQEKKARDISVIDINKVTILSDYFIVCNGTSTTHIKALADEVDYRLTQEGMPGARREGYNSARWILLDYGNIVVHIFHEEDRSFYNLERLWNDGEISRVAD